MHMYVNCNEIHSYLCEFVHLLYIFMLIVLSGLSFGIINTMLMAILERKKEIGMLMSIGMTKIYIFLMI